MKHEPQLTRLEVQGLRALWALEQATVTQIHQALEGTSDLGDLERAFERLESTGIVETVRGEGRDRVYRPAAEPDRVIRREIQRLLDTLFDGEAGPLVSHLANMEDVSRADLQAAVKMLEKRGRKDES